MNHNNKKVKSFLQSRMWAEFQHSLGREHFEFESDVLLGHCFLQKNALGMKYLYCPRGPVLHEMNLDSCGHDPFAEFAQWLKTEANNTRAVYIIIEPESDFIAQMLIGHGFRHQQYAIQPSQTVVVDLMQPLSEIETRLHHKFRYNIRVARRDGIIVRESTDIEPFLELTRKTTERDNFQAHPDEYYRKISAFFEGNISMPLRIYYAYCDTIPVAAAVMLEYDGRGTYLYGASDHAYRKHMAPQLLHWEIMSDLKGRGLQTYDLWGIDMHKYPGVSRFKLQFGGRHIEYPGAFVLPVRELLFYAYTFLRKIKK